MACGSKSEARFTRKEGQYTLVYSLYSFPGRCPPSIWFHVVFPNRITWIGATTLNLHIKDPSCIPLQLLHLASCSSKHPGMVCPMAGTGGAMCQRMAELAKPKAALSSWSQARREKKGPMAPGTMMAVSCFTDVLEASVTNQE